MDDSQYSTYLSESEDGSYVDNSQKENGDDESYVPNTEMGEVFSKRGDEDQSSHPESELGDVIYKRGGEDESFVPETEMHDGFMAKYDAGGYQSPDKVPNKRDVDSGIYFWESEMDGFRHNKGDDVGGGVSQEDFTYDSPMYLYGPDYFSNRLKRRSGRHARPRGPSLGFILERNDDIPEYFKDVVAPELLTGMKVSI